MSDSGGNDDDRARYLRELEAQRRKKEQLEHSAVTAFAAWLGETVKQFVQAKAPAFWKWLKGLFR